MRNRNDRGHGWDTCLQCGKDLRLVGAGRLIVHGPRHNRCPGSGSIGQFVQMLINDAQSRVVGHTGEDTK